MYIEFDKIIIKNFMSIGNTPVEWDIKSSQKLLIQGKNYSGKTTLFQALTFALFGRAYAKIVKKDLVNDVNERGCEVELYFTIGKDTYVIQRKIKPDDFKIFKNGVKIEYNDVSKGDQQTYLEKNILKMDFRAYTQIVMLSTAGFKPFLELSALERRNFIESFLNIEFFTSLNKLIKKDADACFAAVDKLSTEVVGYDRHIGILEQFISTLDNSGSQAEIDTLTSNIKSMMMEYKEMEKSLTLLSSIREKIKYDRDRHNLLIESEREKKAQISYNNNKLTDIRKSIGFFDNNPICPECNQIVDIEHKQKHLDNFTNKMYNTNELNAKLKQEIDNIALEIEMLVKEQTKLKEVDAKEQGIKSKLTWMKEELSKMYKRKLTLESTDTSNTKREKEAELETYKQKRDISYQELLKQKEEKKYFAAMISALKDSGAKTQIINKYVPIICAFVNQTLVKLNMYLKFELDEEFNETLKSRHRSERKYESFSIGERMRLNISLLWAWREVAKIRTGISTNLLAFDEVLENLDVDGFEELLTLVGDDQKLNCVVISHKHGIESLFDKVLSVKKVKGFTQIKFE